MTTTNQNLGVLPNISKEYILSFITQEEIFERYLHIKVQFDVLVCNPLRADRNPTCGFKWSGNKLRFKDFSGYFWGDCFDVVAFLYGLNPNNKFDFIKVLDIVCRDFRLHKYNNSDNLPVIISATPQLIVEKPFEPNNISIQVRPFIQRDLDYFNLYKVIDIECLKRYNVYPTLKAWENGELYYHYKYNDDICYTYYFGVVPKYNLQAVKSYFPNRIQKRFRMNIPVVEGLRLAKGATVGVLTKSYKDVMCINQMSERFNFDCESIGVSSEHQLPSKEDILEMKSKYTYLVSLMDFDFAGRNLAWKLKKQYGIPRLFFTDGQYKTHNYKSKDFSQYLVKNTIEDTARLMDKGINYIIKNYDRDDVIY